MPAHEDPSADRTAQLEEIIANYLSAAETPQPPDPAEWLACFPEFAEELSGFFADQRRLDRLISLFQVELPDDPPRTDLAAGPRTVLTAHHREHVPPRFGDYELLQPIARGGMGVVYKARQISLNRTVAVKMILAGRFASDADIERFRVEAEAAAKLQHPNIVAIHEFAHYEGQHYFSMDFVEGKSLAALIRESPLAPKHAARLAKTTAEAIHYAHEHGVLHRDVKPSNILIDPSGQPHITDFGLARRINEDSDLTRSGAVVGTPSYMSPEQAASRRTQVGPPSDVYSIGAVLYEMLTGRPPFRAETPLETLSQVLDGQVVVPRLLNRRIPRDLETITLKSLEKKLHGRYASAKELADDLGRYLAGLPVRARPIGALQRWWRWSCRHKLGAAMILLLTAATVGSTAAAILIAAARAEALEAKKKATISLARETAALTQEREAKERVAALAEANRRQLERLSIVQGEQLIGQEDLSAALLWLVRALQLAEQGGGRSELHRFRIAAVLRQCPTIAQMQFHSGAVNQVQFSPDGRLGLSAGDDGQVQLWGAAAGETLDSSPLMHSAPVHTAAFSHDSERVVVATEAGTVHLWDVRTGKQMTPPMEHSQPVMHAAFSPDSETVVTLSGSKYQTTTYRTLKIPGPMRELTIPNGKGGFQRIQVPGPMQEIPLVQNPKGVTQLWDTRTGQPRKQIMSQSGWINYASFSPDGRRLATAGGSIIGKSHTRIWDVASAALSAQLDHEREVNWVMFSPDGRRLVTASGRAYSAGGEARIWDTDTGQPVGQPLEHAHQVIQATFSPDGRLVLTASWDQTARLWNADTGEPSGPALKHADRLTLAEFSPDGKSVLTASWDQTARAWDTASGEPITPPLRHSSPVLSAAFGRDGRQVATGTADGVVVVWDLGTISQPIRLEHSAPVTAAVFNSAGRIVVTTTGKRQTVLATGGIRFAAFEELIPAKLAIWDWTKRKPVGGPISQIMSLATSSLSLDGDRVVTVSQLEQGANGQPQTVWQATVWRLDTGRAVGVPLRSPDPIQLATFVADGRCLAVTAAEDVAESKWAARVFDAVSGQSLTAPLVHDVRIARATISADGRFLVTVTQQASLWRHHLWSLESGMPIAAPVSHSGPVSGVSFSRDGQRLLVVGGNRLFEPDRHGSVSVWDPFQRKEISRIQHYGDVTSAEFSSEGDRIVTSSKDRTARVWDALRGRPLVPPLRHTGTVNSASFSSDGRYVVTASSDRTARVWDAYTGDPLTPPLKHAESATWAVFDRETQRIVTASVDGVARIWPIHADDRPAEDLLDLTQLLAGHRIDDTGGSVPLQLQEHKTAWERLQTKNVPHLPPP